jgi:hypothetical protein
VRPRRDLRAPADAGEVGRELGDLVDGGMGVLLQALFGIAVWSESWRLLKLAHSVGTR